MLRLMCNSENLSLIELEFGVKVKAVLQGMLFLRLFFQVVEARKLAFDAQNMGKVEGKITLKYYYFRKREKKSHCLQHPASWLRCCFARFAKQSLARINRVLKLMIGTAFT